MLIPHYHLPEVANVAIRLTIVASKGRCRVRNATYPAADLTSGRLGSFVFKYAAPTVSAVVSRVDSVEHSHTSHESVGLPKHGLGVGLMIGASAEAGVGAGAGATAAVGAGLFYDGKRNVSQGAFAGAGAFAGIGNRGLNAAHSPDPVGAVGLYAGAGIGAFVTNAASVKQLEGISQTCSLNVGVGPVKISLQASAAHGTFLGSVSIGPGIGLDASCYPSQNITSAR